MGKKKTQGWFRRNGLSVVLFAIMLFAWCGQAITGWKVDNDERQENAEPPLSLRNYLTDDHFWSATAENWESEFLQMGLFVLLTIWLRQQGSSESKKLEGREEVDREPRAGPNAPWPVKRGGWVLWFYRNSLSIAFFLLFLFSFLLHLSASYGRFNAEQLAKGGEHMSFGRFATSHQFWFESLQNWQSEFLAVFALVVLSIFLRQHGSPQSKPVDAPDRETGE